MAYDGWLQSNPGSMTGGGAASGAMTGMQAGSVAGPYGMAAGAVLGAAAGGILGHQMGKIAQKGKKLAKEQQGFERAQQLQANTAQRVETQDSATKASQNAFANEGANVGPSSSIIGDQQREIEMARQNRVNAIDRQRAAMQYGFQVEDKMRQYQMQMQKLQNMMSMMSSVGGGMGSGGIAGGLSGGLNAGAQGGMQGGY